jgi:two-component system, OmpR family, response regulator RegX3
MSDSSGQRLLVVEDDDTIAVPLEQGLERWGFEVKRAATMQEALAAPDADLVLLDLGLPDGDGFEFCRQLRAGSDVPVIVVSARADEIDRVVGLEVGADDYVVKPFSLRELVARIRAVLRRTRPSRAEPEEQSVGPLSVDPRTRRATLDGRELALTPKEFDLLALLAREPGAVHRRERILEDVWDQDWFGPTKTLDVHVAALRRKLGDPRWIETLRGVGFRLQPPA